MGIGPPQAESRTQSSTQGVGCVSSPSRSVTNSIDLTAATIPITAPRTTHSVRPIKPSLRGGGTTQTTRRQVSRMIGTKSCTSANPLVDHWPWVFQRHMAVDHRDPHLPATQQPDGSLPPRRHDVRLTCLAHGGSRNVCHSGRSRQHGLVTIQGRSCVPSLSTSCSRFHGRHPRCSRQ